VEGEIAPRPVPSILEPVTEIREDERRFVVGRFSGMGTEFVSRQPVDDLFPKQKTPVKRPWLAR